ncbi:hypothetical protein CEXT_528001 [Caerostris extrusa]|uniref:Uncharacterized protein n=1 Tax=Caerostris extrusa TaxID=172846 RepID=A0AAV4XD56_CAEEX|nr:hypothetical protein CEXT_528001 [Caerostris extrusa]
MAVAWNGRQEKPPPFDIFIYPEESVLGIADWGSRGHLQWCQEHSKRFSYSLNCVGSFRPLILPFSFSLH